MFVIDVPNFSIRQTFYSGQTLLWNRYDRNADHTRYTIQHEDKLLGAAQKGDRLLLNCSEEDFFNIWFRYFDIGTDYMKVNHSLRECMGHMREYADYASGVHLLNQGLHESVLASILMYRQNLFNAKRLMRWICENMGEESRKLVKGLGSVKYFTVPTVEQMYEKIYLLYETFFNVEEPSDQQALDLCTMDLVYCYVMDCYDGLFGEGMGDGKTSEQLMRNLRMYDWLPVDKLCERVALHAFGKRDVFPRSKFLESKIRKHTRMDFDLFIDWYLQGSEYKGYASQYVMYGALNPIERLDKWVW